MDSGWRLACNLRLDFLSCTIAAAVTPCKIIFQYVTIDETTGLVLAGPFVVEHMRSILYYDSKFKNKFEIKFAVASAVDIARNLKSSDFILVSNLQSCKLYELVAKCFCMFRELLYVITKEDRNIEVVTHLENRTLLSLKKDRGLLYLRAASAFPKNDNWPKWDFPEKASYIALTHEFFLFLTKKMHFTHLNPSLPQPFLKKSASLKTYKLWYFFDR